jgi:hypothetical protein
MAQRDAFNPQGPLVHIAAAIAASAPTPVQLIVQTNGAIPREAMEITNQSLTDAYLVHASTSAAAAIIAALGVPAAGAFQAGMLHIPAGADKCYSLRSDEFYTAITASGSADLFLLAGTGE